MGFKLNNKKIRHDLIRQVQKLGSKFGTNKFSLGKSAIVEFSSPNIAKPFHAGHLRSTIIGAFTRNALEANGWETLSMNYLGDWGKQYGILH
jgi:arginyl-tRNA synthetase